MPRGQWKAPGIIPSRSSSRTSRRSTNTTSSRPWRARASSRLSVLIRDFASSTSRRNPFASFTASLRLVVEPELLERVAGLGDVTAARREGPRDLADVDVPPRVHRDAVRRREAPGGRRVGAAPAREHAPVLVVDADAARADVAGRTVASRRLARLPPELRDVGTALRVEHDVGRAARIGPLREVAAVGIEDLDAVVLAVADEDASVGGHGDAVGQEEFARALTRHAPRALQLAGRRELVH